MTRQRDEFKKLLEKQVETWGRGDVSEEPATHAKDSAGGRDGANSAANRKLLASAEKEWKNSIHVLKQDYDRTRAEWQSRLQQLEVKLETTAKRATEAEIKAAVRPAINF